jgi:hypothetical protein
VYGPTAAGYPKIGQWFVDNQLFSAGQTRRFTHAFTIPSSEPTGPYHVHVGIFKPGWAGVYSFDNNAAGFTVR